MRNCEVFNVMILIIQDYMWKKSAVNRKPMRRKTPAVAFWFN